jgi:hypothetical protein
VWSKVTGRGTGMATARKPRVAVLTRNSHSKRQSTFSISVRASCVYCCASEIAKGQGPKLKHHAANHALGLVKVCSVRCWDYVAAVDQAVARARGGRPGPAHRVPSRPSEALVQPDRGSTCPRPVVAQPQRVGPNSGSPHEESSRETSSRPPSRNPPGCDGGT